MLSEFLLSLDMSKSTVGFVLVSRGPTGNMVKRIYKEKIDDLKIRPIEQLEDQEIEDRDNIMIRTLQLEQRRSKEDKHD